VKTETTRWPRGSEWRRWDLHIHTPGTAHENRYTNWGQFLEALQNASGIAAIGVTDYLDISNYLRVRDAAAAELLPNIDLIIPNIEFRVMPPTAKNPGANVHLLVDPSPLDHPQQIRHALSLLTFGYKDNKYPCSRDSLISLGRAVEGRELGDDAAYKKGVEQFRPDLSAFISWWRNHEWLRENSIIGVVAGGDGLSGWPIEGALRAIRENLTRLGHFIFSGRPGEIDYWLLMKEGMDIEYAKGLGAPKPCLHGSDAHDLETLFRPDLDRYCWVKADPTFDGVRQVLFEPALRVYVGPEPPQVYDRSQVIDRLRIDDPYKWFKTTEIPLNSGLIAVIGKKGSGKSALAELCALATGAWVEEDRAFLSRAGGELRGLKARVDWLDGQPTEGEVGGSQRDEFPAVQYLSQSFVERLCGGDDSSSQELVKEIESVIFEGLEESDRLGYGTFDELRAAKTQASLARQSAIKKRFDELLAEWKALVANRALLSEREKRLKAVDREREELRKQLPLENADTRAGEGVLTRLQKVQDALASLEQAEGEDKKLLAQIEVLRGRVEEFRHEMKRFGDDTARAAIAVGISQEAATAFTPSFAGDVDALLIGQIAEVQERVNKRRGETSGPAVGTLLWERQQLTALQKDLATDKARRERLVKQTSRIAELDKESGRLRREIEEVRGPEAARLDAIRSERSALYEELWSAIGEERAALEGLYSSVTVEAEDLRFTVDIAVDLDGWLSRGLDMFDRRKAVPFGSAEMLKKHCVDRWKPAWQSGESSRALDITEELRRELDQLGQSRSYELRSGYSKTDLVEWVFSTEHISLVYGLKHRGVELRKLSPGTKGILLLMVYLGIARRDTRPLIIDQPEENLDNESIYGSLVKYFKEAKKRRQIILITHNPNLVVNGDADQVIVASAERQDDGSPAINYVFGSLEHSVPPDGGIREQVCQILEGGEEAFRKRERRYLLHH
jgi:hypothetical protein